MNFLLKQIVSFFTVNSGSKLLALLLAVVTWYGIRRAISFEVTTPDVRVVVTPPPGFAIQYQSESHVDVTFRGSQEDIRLLDVKRLLVTAEMRHVDEPGSYELNLTPEHVEGARGVRPFRIHPTRLRAELDREEEKKVPVRPRITGRPLAGQVESVVSDPSVVTLRGPARQLRLVDQVHTVPIDVEGRIESFTRRVAMAQPGDTWYVQIDPDEVEVEVLITATPASREWPDQRVKAVVAAGGRRRRIQIEPQRVHVVANGNAEILDRLDSPLVYVDCVDLEPETSYELPVQVLVRDLDVETQTQPSSVTVMVREY